LIGTTSNRQALGTKVTIHTGTTIQYRELNGADGHFLSQGAAPVHFGLGATAVIDKLDVIWPSRRKQTLKNVLADQEITVTEKQ
jgi:hypothetical protein